MPLNNVSILLKLERSADNTSLILETFNVWRSSGPGSSVDLVVAAAGVGSGVVAVAAAVPAAAAPAPTAAPANVGSIAAVAVGSSAGAAVGSSAAGSSAAGSSIGVSSAGGSSVVGCSNNIFSIFLRTYSLTKRSFCSRVKFSILSFKTSLTSFS